MKRILDVALVLTFAVVVASCGAETAATTLVLTTIESTTSSEPSTSTSDATTTTEATTTSSTPAGATPSSQPFIMSWDGGLMAGGTKRLSTRPSARV